MRRRAFLGGLTVAGASALAGCSNPLSSDDPPLENLEIAIDDVRSPDIGLSSATVPVIIELFNAHEDAPIPEPTLDWDGYINDDQVVSGISNPDTVGAQETITSELEFIVDYSDVGSALVSAIQDGSFTVGYEGSIESGGASREFADSYSV